jgi:hypothetical protein
MVNLIAITSDQILLQSQYDRLYNIIARNTRRKEQTVVAYDVEVVSNNYDKLRQLGSTVIDCRSKLYVSEADTNTGIYKYIDEYIDRYDQIELFIGGTEIYNSTIILLTAGYKQTSITVVRWDTMQVYTKTYKKKKTCTNSTECVDVLRTQVGTDLTHVANIRFETESDNETLYTAIRTGDLLHMTKYIGDNFDTRQFIVYHSIRYYWKLENLDSTLRQTCEQMVSNPEYFTVRNDVLISEYYCTTAECLGHNTDTLRPVLFSTLFCRAVIREIRQTISKMLIQSDKFVTTCKELFPSLSVRVPKEVRKKDGASRGRMATGAALLLFGTMIYHQDHTYDHGITNRTRYGNNYTLYNNHTDTYNMSSEIPDVIFSHRFELLPIRHLITHCYQMASSAIGSNINYYIKVGVITNALLTVRHDVVVDIWVRDLIEKIEERYRDVIKRLREIFKEIYAPLTSSDNSNLVFIFVCNMIGMEL